MLSSGNRLKSHRDIGRVYKRGRFVFGGSVTIKFNSNSLGESRALVVVSKKVSKKAVIRNRIRRRLSGLLKELWETVVPGYDIVITVREDVNDIKQPQLEKILKVALERSHLIKPQ